MRRRLRWADTVATATGSGMVLQAVSTRTTRIALIIFCAIGLLLLALVGLFALPQNPLRTRLGCDRGSGQCVFEQVFHRETRRWPFHVDELRRATVVYVHGMHGGGRSSVYFEVGAQRYFYASFTFRGAADKAAAGIDAFVGNPAQQRLAIVQDGAVADGIARGLLLLAALSIVGFFAFAWRKMRG